MNSDNSMTGMFSVFLVVGLIFGASFGCIIQSQETERVIIKYCVEKPKECKIKYDYIKLGETK